MNDLLKKIDFRKILDYLDGLTERIPSNVATLLKSLFALAIIAGLLYGAFYGAKVGKQMASQSGQDLAKDTRTLFKEEIEREYNRKRKNIRMPAPEDLVEDKLYQQKMEYEYHTRTAPVNAELLDADRKVLERKGLRSIQSNGKSVLYEIEEDDPEATPLENTYNPSAPSKGNSTLPNDATEPGKEEELLEKSSNEPSDKKLLRRKNLNLKNSPEQKTKDLDKTLPFPTEKKEKSKETIMEVEDPTGN